MCGGRYFYHSQRLIRCQHLYSLLPSEQLCSFESCCWGSHPFQPSFLYRRLIGFRSVWSSCFVFDGQFGHSNIYTREIWRLCLMCGGRFYYGLFPRFLRLWLPSPLEGSFGISVCWWDWFGIFYCSLTNLTAFLSGNSVAGICVLGGLHRRTRIQSRYYYR